MSFTAQIIEVVVLAAAALLWAKWSKLDLGLRAPATTGVWPWTLFFIAWVLVEQLVLALRPAAIETDALRDLEHLSMAQYLLLMVVLVPLEEELLFRGALYSALMRRWGSMISITVSSFAWSIVHTQYGPWLMASVMGSGVLLAMIRWKSGSIYMPAALHAGANLLGLISPLALS